MSEIPQSERKAKCRVCGHLLSQTTELDDLLCCDTSGGGVRGRHNCTSAAHNWALTNMPGSAKQLFSHGGWWRDPLWLVIVDGWIEAGCPK